MNKKLLIIPGIIAAIVLVFLISRSLNTSGDKSTVNSSFDRSESVQPQQISTKFDYASSTEVVVPDNKEIATFAGGCFWCVEAVFQETAGVDNVISGFGGGQEIAPSYEQVVNGLTEHRETIQFTYDPAVISYVNLLDIYWQAIDPTDAGGQFVDRGFIYTTAIFYHSEDQRKVSIASIEELRRARSIDTIATVVLPFTTFYPAEEYHQDYYLKSSSQYKNYESNSGRRAVQGITTN
jgi:peptide methionine sulfoxide reductase msrA/msrB